MGCVPTIFADLLRYADEHPEVDLSSLTNAACGGSAVPRQLMQDFEERHGVRIFQAWGMTETSPVATYSRPREGVHDDAYWESRPSRDRPLPWVELRLVGRRRARRSPGTASRPARSRCADRGSPARYFRDDSGEDEVRRRLAAHRRHRRGRRARLRADHRPGQGRDQVRRRVDLLGRAGERVDVPTPTWSRPR